MPRFCYSALSVFGGISEMRVKKSFQIITLVLLCGALPLYAADKKSKDPNAESAKPSYELPQPGTESIDLTMYQRIRDEGLQHSHVMEFASGLMDGIGPRLTGSPNLKKAN